MDPEDSFPPCLQKRYKIVAEKGTTTHHLGCQHVSTFNNFPTAGGKFSRQDPQRGNQCAFTALRRILGACCGECWGHPDGRRLGGRVLIKVATQIMIRSIVGVGLCRLPGYHFSGHWKYMHFWGIDLCPGGTSGIAETWVVTSQHHNMSTCCWPQCSLHSKTHKTSAPNEMVKVASKPLIRKTESVQVPDVPTKFKPDAEFC